MLAFLGFNRFLLETYYLNLNFSAAERLAEADLDDRMRLCIGHMMSLDVLHEEAVAERIAGERERRRRAKYADMSRIAIARHNYMVGDFSTYYMVDDCSDKADDSGCSDTDIDIEEGEFYDDSCSCALKGF